MCLLEVERFMEDCYTSILERLKGKVWTAHEDKVRTYDITCSIYSNGSTILVKTNWELQHVSTVSPTLGNRSPSPSPACNVAGTSFLTLIFWEGRQQKFSLCCF